MLDFILKWKVNDTATKFLATIASFFTILFLFEAVMKSCALGLFGYWQSRRNRLDMFVTFLGLIWIIMHFISFQKKDLVGILICREISQFLFSYFVI